MILDGRQMAGRSGVARYTRTLVAGLPQFDESRRYQIFGWRRQLPHLAEQAGVERINAVSSVLPGRVLAQLSNFGVPAPRWGLGRPAVFHATAFDVPQFIGMRHIVTCHDVAFLHLPEAYLPGVAADFHCGLERALRYVDVIATQSRHAMEDLLEHYDVSPERVRVLYPAVVDASGRSLHLPHATPRSLPREDQPFLLVVGEINPRKNLVRVVEAFSRMAAVEAEHRLVLAGPDPGDGTYARAVHERVKALGIEAKVDFLGKVSDARLAELYDDCTALVFCSLYEGFGYPLAEAMSRGVPVVTSNISSLPEVAGAAALLVDPNSTEAITDALVRITRDTALRKRLSAEGPVQAAQFSDVALFGEALHLYEDLGV